MLGQDVGILYDHYNNLTIKGLSLRSSCLSSSTRLKVWNQTQLRITFKAQDTGAVGPVQCTVFGPEGLQGCGCTYRAHVTLFLPQVFRIKTVKGLLGRQRRAGWKTGLHFPRSWGWTSAKGMFSVSIMLLWLLVMNIILWVFAKICLWWAIPLLSVQLRSAGRTRCALQSQSWCISVCYGSNLGTFLCLAGVHGVCFLHVHLSDSLWHACKRRVVSLADVGRNSELHPWFDAFPVSASSLLWTITVLCRNLITQSASPLLYPSLSPFQDADGCLAHYLEYFCNLWHSGTIPSLENPTTDLLAGVSLLLKPNRLIRFQATPTCW